ncbi:unnamed protein product [Discula destructiva]
MRKMCVQVDSLFACGHRSFKRFDNCPQFGITCLGAGPDHTVVVAARKCHDCKARDKQRHRQTSPGGSPNRGRGSIGEENDPWAKGDLWKKKKRKR